MLAFIAASMVVPSLVRRVRPAYVMSGGLVLAAVGFALLTRVDGPSALAVLVAGSVVYSLGISPVIILATDLIVGSAPVERAGAASAISETSSELGGALGIALLGSLGTAIYRLHVADSFPQGISHQAAEAARDTLGGAVAAAELLPEPLGLALLESARDAFTQSFIAAAGVNAALALATALLAAVVLRGVPAGSVRHD
jgi:DHA2 family multidrug resistance protein-like MFS transporter